MTLSDKAREIGQRPAHPTVPVNTDAPEKYKGLTIRQALMMHAPETPVQFITEGDNVGFAEYLEQEVAWCAAYADAMLEQMAKEEESDER